jgi:outer membrane murein-binding lipoprotein Lpp
MAGITWKAELSLGNVITIGTLIVGIAAGWQSVNSRVDAVEKAAIELKTKVDKLTLDRQDDRNALTEIRADLRYIREAVNRLEDFDVRRGKNTGQP